MNINYLYSMVNLYLKNENDHQRLKINITKKEDSVLFSFNMKKEDIDKTSIKLPMQIVNEHFYDIIQLFKGDLLIIDEKYDYDKVKDECYYYIKLNNGRMIIFNGFSLMELNTIRNIIYNIDIRQDEIRIGKEEEEILPNKWNLKYAGFISPVTIFLVTIIILVVFVISLLIFSLVTK